MSRAWLGIGGNVGDVPMAMRNAFDCFGRRVDCRLIRVSGLYRTAPWGRADQPDFYNSAFEIEISLEPEELLQLSLSIEQASGRNRQEKWGPRTLDIYVLIHDRVEQYDSETLTLPHPYMTQRGFVLIPLAEIAPQLLLNGRTVAQWAQNSDISGIEKMQIDEYWWQPLPDKL